MGKCGVLLVHVCWPSKCLPAAWLCSVYALSTNTKSNLYPCVCSSVCPTWNTFAPIAAMRTPHIFSQTSKFTRNSHRSEFETSEKFNKLKILNDGVKPAWQKNMNDETGKAVKGIEFMQFCCLFLHKFKNKCTAIWCTADEWVQIRVFYIDNALLQRQSEKSSTACNEPNYFILFLIFKLKCKFYTSDDVANTLCFENGKISSFKLW